MSAEALKSRGLLVAAQRIARDNHITIDEMLSESRVRPIPRARGQFYAHLHALGWSYSHIGRLMGKDHTTILNQVKRWRAP